MKINPVVIGLPLVALFLFSGKKTTVTKPKENKPVEKPKPEPNPTPNEKEPIQGGNGFTLKDCSNFKVTDEGLFAHYLDVVLSDLLKNNNNPSKITPFEFGVLFMSEFGNFTNDKSPCKVLFDNNEISTKEQFVLIYSLIQKGMWYFINKILLGNDNQNWMKYNFINLIQVEDYINKSQYKFDEWFENVTVGGYTAEQYNEYSKIFDLDEIPETPITLVDPGFEYNCSSVKLFDMTKVSDYFSQIAKYLQVSIPKYKNPMDLDLWDYSISAFAFMAPNCYELYKNGGMKPQEYVIMLKMITSLITAYVTNNFKNSPDDMTKYKTLIINPQWNSIKENTFAFITEVDLQAFDTAIEQKKQYP